MVFKKYENAALEKSYRTLTSTKMCKSLVDLQKNCSPALNSEPKNVATSSQGPLAHVLLLLAALRPLLVGFPSEKSILPYFSSLRGVAILDCDSHSQAGSTTFSPGRREEFTDNFQSDKSCQKYTFLLVLCFSGKSYLVIKVIKNVWLFTCSLRLSW